MVPPLRPSNEHSALSLSLSTLSMGEWPASSQRARVDRGPSEGARSASTESGRPLPHHRTTMMMNQADIRPEDTHADPSAESEREKRS